MPRLLRSFAAALVLAGGAFHLSLYLDGYRSVPRIGVLFLLNAAVSVALALALVIRPLGASAVAAIVFAAGTMVAFVLSRTTGLLGFTEVGFDTKSAATFAIEALSLAVIALWFTATRPQPDAVRLVGLRVRDDRRRSR